MRGNSGCKLEIIQSNHAIVRKISYDINYNKRLQSQMILQSNFHDKDIYTPSIFSSGYIDGKYYFDMEYINGNNLVYWLESADLDSIKKKINSILTQISSNEPLELKNKINYDINLIISDKFKTIEKTVVSEEFQNAIISCKDVILNFDYNSIPLSKCHGDLTLENILISEDDKIYFIDFLDSFVESWLIDISKLLQDSLLFWSLRLRLNKISYNHVIRLNSVSDSIFSYMHLNFDKYYVDLIFRLLLINVLRIIPYCKDLNTSQWIIESTNELLKYIKGERKWY
jgi:hypothetical protein